MLFQKRNDFNGKKLQIKWIFFMNSEDRPKQRHPHTAVYPAFRSSANAAALTVGLRPCFNRA